MGVHTGEVVAYAADTGGKVEYRLIGHAANLAARLEALAPVGSIVTSEDTRNLCEGYFELRELGPTTVKGIKEPINVYEVIGLGPQRSHFELSARRGLTNFVGRSHELDQMRRALELAQSGRGQLIAVVAEAGTGKSRLFHEFKALIPAACKVLEAYAVSHGKGTAWLPVLQLLRNYFGIRDADDAASRRANIRGALSALDPSPDDMLPYLFALLSIVEGPDPMAQMDPQVKQRRTLEVIKRIVLRDSLQHPLVIILEDLHWIDDHTQALLDLLADSVANAPVLLLVNYRPEYRHEWANKSYYSQLGLTALDSDGAAAMLMALLGAAAELGPLKAMIVERTEGNPFFIEEMVQALFDGGALLRNGVVKVANSLSQLRLPPTVQGMLASRIDRLADEQKELLQTLAVIGRESQLELIRRIVSRSDTRLERMLAELQNAEFIYEQLGSRDTEYIFKHALTQEVAYGSLLIGRRKLLHERVGAAFESAFAARLSDHISDLAYHYSRSENHRKAIEYLHLAGRQATARAAHHEAIYHFRAALERLKDLPGPRDDEKYCTLLLALADEQERAGELREAHQTWSRVVDVGRSLSSPENLVNAALGFVRLAVRVGFSAEGVAGLLETALLKVRPEDGPIRAKILCGLAALLGSTGERERAIDLGDQGLAMSRRLGNPELLCRNLTLVNFGLPMVWNTARLLSYATEMVELSRVSKDKNSEAEGRDWMVQALFHLGDISAADRENDAAARLAQELDEPFNQGLALGYKAARALMRGQFDESEQFARQAFAIGQRLQTEAAAGVFGLQMFALARERGQVKELEPVLQLFMRERGAASSWRTGLALIYAELGRTDEARSEFNDLARNNFVDLPQDALWTGSMAYLTDVCLCVGDKVRATRLYQMLLPYDGTNLVVGYGVVCYGALSRYLGVLASLLENWDDAERHFNDALAMNTRMQAPVWVAHTQYHYANMLLGRGRPSDYEQGLAMLNSAVVTARQLGMRTLEKRSAAAMAGPLPSRNSGNPNEPN